MHLDNNGHISVSAQVIGFIMGIIFNIIIPLVKAKDMLIDWGLHTLGALATAVIVAFTVHYFQKFLKRRDRIEAEKIEKKKKEKIDGISTIV